MNRKFYQLMLTSRLGDGYLKKDGSASFTSIEEDYIAFKKDIIESVFPNRDIKSRYNTGYKKDSKIYSISTLVSDLGKEIYKMPLQDVINELDEFGLAIWAYDDGSLHQKNLFYNLNSHAIPEEIQRDVLIPKLRSFGLSGARIFKERKKDGREFRYISIPKFKGAYELDAIMRKIKVDSYSYKLLPCEYKEAYTHFKKLFSGKNMSQRTLSLLISEKLFGENFFLDRVKDYDGYITTSKYKPKEDISVDYTITL